MLPFPQLLQYGNKSSSKWYTESDGSLLSAYDSSNFNSVGFSDYCNNQQVCINNVLGTVGSYPSLYNDTSFKYGTGILMNFRSAIYTTAIPTVQWTKSWTVDYWMRLDTFTAGTLQTNASYLFVNQNIVSGTNYNSRLLLQRDTDRSYVLSLWNNAASPKVVATATNNEVLSTSWHHIAFTYTGGVLRFFIDGQVKQTFNYTILNPSQAVQTGIYGYQWSGTNKTVIERFRLRSKAVWTTNFDTNTIY